MMPSKILNEASGGPNPTSVPDRYLIGDGLKWDAPWTDVCLWTELPFWLMVANSKFNVECDGHEFPISVHDNYFELYFGEALDSRMTVGYRGPIKSRENLPDPVRLAMDQRPDGPYMWRKCKSYVKIGSRCNEDVWNGASSIDKSRANEIRLYLSELCRAHVPVVNRFIRAYRLSTYDYFPYEVAPWDVPHWSVERGGQSVSATLVEYRAWDIKPLLYGTSSERPKMYSLIQADDLRSRLGVVGTPGELELLDALNLMERGDYSGAVRRVTTAIEVVVEYVVGSAVEAAKGRREAERFLKDTRMRFEQRVRRYEGLTGRSMSASSLKTLRETRSLRHQIVHGGYRIGPSERGRAQRAVDTGRWAFNWFENDTARRDTREKRIGLRSLGRDLSAGVFRPTITPEGVVLSPIRAT
jgi:hypothetical protein